MFEAKWGIRLVRSLLLRIRIDHKMMPPHSDEQSKFKTLFKWRFAFQMFGNVITLWYTLMISLTVKLFWIIIQSKHCTYYSGIKSVKTLCHSKHAVHLFFFYFSSNIRFRLLLAVLYIYIWIVAIIDLSSKKILWFIVLTWWMSGKRRQSTREVIRFPFLLLYAIVFTSMVFRIFVEIGCCCVFASGIAEHFNMEQVSDFRVYLLK